MEHMSASASVTEHRESREHDVVVRRALQIPALRIILIAALSIRALVAVLAFARDTTSSPDTLTYVRPAESLVAVGRFDSYGAPELSRTPGYPMLLAIGEAAGHLVPVTLALQVLLNTATVFGVAALALALGTSTRVATIGAALYAFEPSSIVYVSEVMTETLFTAVITALLIVLTCWVRTRETRLLLAGSLLLAAGSFVRPILYIVPAPLAALIGVIAWRHHGARSRALAHAALFFIIAATPIAAWRARNTLVAGYDRFAAITDINLLYYRAAGVLARRSGQAIDSVQLRLRREWGADTSLSAVGRTARGRERTSRYYGMRAQAREILVNDPPAVAMDALAGASRTVLGRDTSEWSELLGLQPGSSGWQLVRITLTLLWHPMVALGLLGLWRGGLNGYVLLPVLLASVYLVTAAAGPEAYSRFRLAIVPVVAVLAACGAVYVWDRVRPRLSS